MITDNTTIEQSSFLNTKEKTALLQVILDYTPDGIIIIDNQGKIKVVNASINKMFGYKTSELTNQNILSLIPAAFSHHKSITEQTITELSGKRKDSSLFPIDFSIRKINKAGSSDDFSFMIAIRDITKRKNTEYELLEVQRRIEEIMAALPCCLYKGIIYPDRQVKMEYISQSSKDILGIEASAITNKSSLFYNAFVPSDRKSILSNHKTLLNDSIPQVLDKAVQLKNGKWVQLHAFPTKDKAGNISWNGIIFDITEKRIAEDRLHFLAYHDPLTEVGNRELLYRHFGNILTSTDKSKKNIAVLSLAPDGLGQINAVSGLAIGDKVLREFARRLSGILSNKDLFVRMAGHRFIILLTDLSSHAAANKTIGKIIKEFEKPIIINEQEFDLGVTIGVCFYPVDGKEPDTLISHADAALDAAKAKNKGTATIFSEELSIILARSMRIRTELKNALEDKKILAYFQPQVNVLTGEIVGIEALARWKTDKSVISPAEFIPIAEEYGLIDELTWQVLTEACKWAKKWQKKGYGKIPVAVNISGNLFKKPKQLVSKIQTTLKETGLAPELLEVELTESTAMLDPALAISVINQLRATGISCSIDDFGTGYSSLAMLKTFPLKKLKIDRSFVLDLTSDPNDTAIVRATIAIARTLNLTVLAEGVETKNHFDILKNIGCDIIQGYLFSCPLPPQDMEEMLKHWDAKKVISDLSD